MTPRPSLAARLRAVLAGPRASASAIVLGVLVLVPSLWHGLLVDDHWQRIYLLRAARWAPAVQPPLELFTFFDGHAARAQWFLDQGITAWWTDLAIRIAFFRPISALTHWFDYLVWPDAPVLMHAHSIAWYAALVALVAALYRRLLGVGLAAGLAAVCYAVDYTHGLPAAWIANRNAVVASVFGLLALLFHDRARRGGGWAKLLAPVFLLIGLFSGETAVGALGYFAAYALFLEEAPASSPGWVSWVWARAKTLLPYAPVVLFWVIVYRGGDYGARGSGMYVDPAQQPLAYLTSVAQHFPMLMAHELGLPIADLYGLVPTSAKAVMLIAACVVLGLAAFAFAPLVRRSREGRFFLAGALLSILPGCATIPSARLLLLSSVGWMGLVSMLAAAVIERATLLSPPLATGARLRTALIAYMAGGHLFFAPFAFQIAARQMVIFEGLVRPFADSLPDDAALDRKRVVIVNTPDAGFIGYTSIIRFSEGRVTPASLLSLAVGTRPVALERRDARTMVVRSEGGFYQSGTDLLTQDLRHNAVPGTRIKLQGVEIEVTRCAPTGIPEEATFRFEEPLESESLVWVTWKGKGFVPFTLPAPGAAVRIEAQALSLSL